MIRLADHRFLQRALLLDAVASAAVGALLLVDADLLAPSFGLPAGLLRSGGWLMVPWVAVLGLALAAGRIGRFTAWCIVETNLAWVAASVVLLAGGWYAPTALGTAFVLAQAAVVAAFAGLQCVGLLRVRRAGGAVPA